MRNVIAMFALSLFASVALAIEPEAPWWYVYGGTASAVGAPPENGVDIYTGDADYPVVYLRSVIPDWCFLVIDERVCVVPPEARFEGHPFGVRTYPDVGHALRAYYEMTLRRLHKNVWLVTTRDVTAIVFRRHN